MTKYKLVPVVPTPEMEAVFKRFQIGRCEWNVLLRAAPEVQAEPVAFCDPSEPNARHAFSWPGTDRQHSHIVPLYTAPQPAKPAEQSLDGKLAMGLAVIRELTGTQKTDNIEATIEAVRKAVAPQPANCEPVAWQPIETAPKGCIVLVHYTNRLGKGRVVRARYYLPETLESENTESGWADEGWYEESEAYEYLMPLEGEPRHWMSLPQHPTPKPTVAELEKKSHLDHNRLCEYAQQHRLDFSSIFS